MSETWPARFSARNLETGEQAVLNLAPVPRDQWVDCDDFQRQMGEWKHRVVRLSKERYERRRRGQG